MKRILSVLLLAASVGWAQHGYSTANSFVSFNTGPNAIRSSKENNRYQEKPHMQQYNMYEPRVNYEQHDMYEPRVNYEQHDMYEPNMAYEQSNLYREEPYLSYQDPYVYERPSYGGNPYQQRGYNRPNYETPRPNYGASRPNYETNRANYGSRRPYSNAHPSQNAMDSPKSSENPEYLGTFRHAKNLVSGHIFKLNEHQLYIQDFSFDGQAPDVYFWSDGVPIPYYTRSNPNKIEKRVGEYHHEDIVLNLPPEKPTLKAMGHFMVWCRQYHINFGEFSMN